MIQICIMSGHDGQLGSEKKVYFTLMGACDLLRPTFARQIVARRRDQGDGAGKPARQVFITLMGATEIKAPTLVEEYTDLRELLQSGALTLADWDRYAAEVDRSDVSVASFSLMAGFSECELPSENEEVDGLAMQRHLGNIPPSAGEILQHGIGLRGAERRATLRRALSVAT
jgi:hypothetical protein